MNESETLTSSDVGSVEQIAEAPPVRMALVRAGSVENIILVGADFMPPEDVQLVDDSEEKAAIGGTWDGKEFAPPSVVVDRAALAQQIDDAVIAVYDKPMKLSAEYKQRETQARACRDANYAIAAPRVQAFADNEGITLRQAVDVTIAQADAMYGALDALSDLRMSKRYLTRTDVGDEQALQKFRDAMAKISSIARQLS
jgi:hypothetical protein